MRFSTIIIVIIVLALILTGLFFAFRPTTDKPETKTAAVKITATGMRPNNISYNEGDTANLTFNSVVDGIVHIHGYDIEFPVSVGEATQIELSLQKAGRFEIELHYQNNTSHSHDHSGQTTHGSDKLLHLGFLDVQPRNP